MMFLATGCSKAQIIKQYDNVLQSIGEKSITKERFFGETDLPFLTWQHPL